VNARAQRLGGYAAVVCDVDGVLHVGGNPLPGAATWIDTVLEAGLALLLVTNASWERRVTLERLASAGITVSPSLVVTSGDAVVAELEASNISRAAVLGSGGVVEALAESTVEEVEPATLRFASEDGALVIGAGADPDDARAWVRRLAPLGIPVVSTNRDTVYAGASGVVAGPGRLIAELEREFPGVRIRGCGKPYEPMARVVRRRLRGVGPLLVVGDNGNVDIPFARRLGADSLLVLTGTATEAGSVAPTFVVDDLDRALELLGDGLPR